MSNSNPTNFAASVYAKLKNISNAEDWNFMHVLIRYATERFLYRLSVSKYQNQFILKGGNLFIIWQSGRNYRPTVDSDFLCFDNGAENKLKPIFIELCNTSCTPQDVCDMMRTALKLLKYFKMPNIQESVFSCLHF